MVKHLFSILFFNHCKYIKRLNQKKEGEDDTYAFFLRERAELCENAQMASRT